MDLDVGFTRARARGSLKTKCNSYYQFADFEVHHGKAGKNEIVMSELVAYVIVMSSFTRNER